ncbi:MAG: phosphoenolpyruvate carboxykinase (GTP) [Oscillospiraceae bacterium]|nr:phosphoenolpyruvate carboxykinase (GTP) [Oscillospiraceae bacterium]
MTTNQTVLNWVKEINALTKPDNEVWIDGTPRQLEELRIQALNAGILKPLNEDKLPGCTLHRTAISDAAHTERRMFVCTETPEEAGPANLRIPPDEIKPKLSKMFKGVMAGRTMYVIPLILGIPDSPMCKAGIQITDSLYTAINTSILAKCGYEAVKILDGLAENESDTPEQAETADITDSADITDAPDKSEASDIAETAEVVKKSDKSEKPVILKVMKTEWFRGVHSTGTSETRKNPNPDVREDNRYICHFPQENSVWTINTGYGTNAFLSKKSMALQLASCTAKEEGWLAEHMSIMEITDSDGDVFYIAVAFPSGCGKTSLAMMEVPPRFAEKGYKVRCISDDVAWLKKGEDGRLRAINPETGIFGSLPGINGESSPNVLAMAQKDAILTNTVQKIEDNTVWWEGLDNEEIVNALDWKGNPWTYTPVEAPPETTESDSDKESDFDDEDGDFDESETESDDFGYDDDERDEDEEDEEEVIPVNNPDADSDLKEEKSDDLAKVVKGAHPNSRFTADIRNCPNLSDKYGDPKGVPVSAIIFGGRRSKAVPLVYQAFDWEHGVFIGTVLGTEPIKTTGSGSPSVRRNPMAMQSYCGYNMADYWQHWLKTGKKLGRNAPKVFNVNWFKAGDNGKPIWPGFGENIRVLEWIVKRLKMKCSITETPVGYSPKLDDIDFTGLSLTPENLHSLFVVDKTQWKEDVNSIKQFYGKFGDRLPKNLREQLIDLEKRLINANKKD